MNVEGSRPVDVAVRPDRRFHRPSKMEKSWANQKMEATESSKPFVEETFRVNPADLAELEPLTEEELQALGASDDSTEDKPEENPSKETYAKIGISLLGGIVGFVGAGYLNNYVMTQLQKTASVTTPLTATQLLQYSAVIFVVELIVAGFLLYYCSKHAGKHMDFLYSFGTGVAVAGFGTVFSQYLINSGNSTSPVLPAVNFSGKPFVPANRVVST
jgi:hypothetical protein